MNKSDERARHSFKAPGRPNWISMSLANFFRLLSDDLSTEALLGGVRWSDGPSCPHCDGARISQVKNRKPLPWRCKDWRRLFSVRFRTVMQDLNLDLQTRLLAHYLLATRSKGTSRMKTRKFLAVSQKTACILTHNTRKGMRQGNSLLSELVEADISYMGGSIEYKHTYKRIRPTDRPFRKAIVASVRGRESSQVAAHVALATETLMLAGTVTDHAEQGAEVFPDEARDFLPLGRMTYEHQTVKHSVSEYVLDQAHTNGLESFCATLKRCCHGMYHSVSEERLHRIVGECQGRHSLRPDYTIDLIASLVRRTEGRPLLHKELIADGPWAKRNRVAA